MPRKSRTRLLRDQARVIHRARRRHTDESCCGKVTYLDAIRASHALSKIHRYTDGAAEKVPVRVYQCEQGNYHLTAIEVWVEPVRASA